MFNLPLIGSGLRRFYHVGRRLGALEAMPGGRASANGELGEADVQKILDLLVAQESAALGRHADLEKRFEFVRLELMYEIQHRLAQAGTPGAHKITQDGKIENQSALAAAAVGDYRLNVGCGHKPLEGWINVDLRPLPGVDITATADNVPLPAGSCAALTSAHLMEHFMEEDLRRRVLPHWFSLLKPGGSLTAIVPDGGAMMRAWVAGDMDFETLRLITYGQQEYDGDFHFTMFTPASLGKLLEEAGFTSVEIVAEARENGLCLEFEIRATRL